jgi:hypothetical protein
MNTIEDILTIRMQDYKYYGAGAGLKMKLSKFLLIIILFTNCHQEIYENDNSIENDMQYLYYETCEHIEGDVRVKGHLIESKEEGEFSFTNNNEILKKGKFIEGMRSGVWEYNVFGSKEINWKIENVSKNFSTNFPSTWKDIPVKKANLCKVDSINEITFILSKYEYDTTKKITDFIIEGLTLLQKNHQVITMDLSIFKHNSEEIFFIDATFINNKNNKELNVLNVFKVVGNEVVDISLYLSDTKKVNQCEYESIFIDIIMCTYYNSERIFNPLVSYKTYKTDLINAPLEHEEKNI